MTPVVISRAVYARRAPPRQHLSGGCACGCEPSSGWTCVRGSRGAAVGTNSMAFDRTAPPKHSHQSHYSIASITICLGDRPSRSITRVGRSAGGGSGFFSFSFPSFASSPSRISQVVTVPRASPAKSRTQLRTDCMDVLSRHFSSLSFLPCLRVLVLPLRRPVLFQFIPNRRLYARAREASCTTSAKGVLRRRPMTCPGRSHAPSDTRTTADKSKVLTVTRGAAGKSHTQDASRACAFQPAAATPA